MHGWITKAWTVAGTLLALALVTPAGASAGNTMAVQPGGKIVVVGEAWPGFGAIARFNPDGTRDSSFGTDGATVDRRIAPLRVVTVHPDGRIVAAAEGFQLARYLANGRPDPSFRRGNVGPVESELQSRPGGTTTPEVILVRSDGRIVIGGEHPISDSFNAPQAIARLYNFDGTFSETVGMVPQSTVEPTLTESWLRGLVTTADGSLVMAGSGYGYGYPSYATSLLLARFLPGSGTAYDPSFGGGEGLVRPVFFPSRDFKSEAARAIEQVGGRLIVAGSANGTFLLARYDQDGNLDTQFGNGGFVSPPVEGTSGKFGDSWAQAIAVQEGGRLVIGGGTSKWGRWRFGKSSFPNCDECPQPLLARFTPDGNLDPRFGAGGLVRLMAPRGEALLGEVEQVVSLPDGKILVSGSSPVGNSGRRDLFLARLSADGAFDPSFGDRGLVRVKLPCWGKNLAMLRRQGCIASARIRFHVGGLSGVWPTVSLQVKPSLPWARIGLVRLQLPPALRAGGALPRKTRVVALGGVKGNSSAGGPRRYLGAKPVKTKRGRVAFQNLGAPRVLNVRLMPGALRSSKPSGHQKLVFRVTVKFRYKGFAGRQTVVIKTRR